jgi:SAM-dependent methyltransferase
MPRRPFTAPGARRFDGQARSFDRRAGLGRAGREVAAALFDLVGLGEDSLIVEIGAGTGAVGRHLAQRPARYLGLEASAPMLDRFRDRLGDRGHAAELVHTDCNERWPVEDGAARAILASRVVHLLDRGHVACETVRILEPGGWFLLGRVQREPDSVRDLLRTRMREELAERGIEPTDRRAPEQDVVDALLARGFHPVADTVLAEWTVEIAPIDQLEQWSAKSSLGGRELPASVVQEVVSALRSWSIDRFGALDRTAPSVERYAVVGARAEEVDPTGSG